MISFKLEIPNENFIKFEYFSLLEYAAVNLFGLPEHVVVVVKDSFDYFITI